MPFRKGLTPVKWPAPVRLIKCEQEGAKALFMTTTKSSRKRVYDGFQCDFPQPPTACVLCSEGRISRRLRTLMAVALLFGAAGCGGSESHCGGGSPGNNGTNIAVLGAVALGIALTQGDAGIPDPGDDAGMDDACSEDGG